MASRRNDARRARELADDEADVAGRHGLEAALDPACAGPEGDDERRSEKDRCARAGAVSSRRRGEGREGAGATRARRAGGSAGSEGSGGSLFIVVSFGGRKAAMETRFTNGAGPRRSGISRGWSLRS